MIGASKSSFQSTSDNTFGLDDEAVKAARFEEECSGLSNDSTVVIMPEPVMGKDEDMVLVPDRGLVSRSRISDVEISAMTVKCTVCSEQLFNNQTILSHPHLNVIVCKECLSFYADGYFSQDELGDKYCRWCAQGGKLNVCDFCTNAFCNECIRRNFGRGEVQRIKTIKWKCYICKPEQLSGMVAFSKMVLQHYSIKKGKGKKSKKVNGQTHQQANDPGDGDVSSADQRSTPPPWTDSHFEIILHCMNRAVRKIKKIQSRETDSPDRMLQCAARLERLLNKHQNNVRVIVEGLTAAINEKAQNITVDAVVKTPIQSPSLLDGVVDPFAVQIGNGQPRDEEDGPIDVCEVVNGLISNCKDENSSDQQLEETLPLDSGLEPDIVAEVTNPESPHANDRNAGSTVCMNRKDEEVCVEKIEVGELNLSTAKISPLPVMDFDEDGDAEDLNSTIPIKCSFSSDDMAVMSSPFLSEEDNGSSDEKNRRKSKRSSKSSKVQSSEEDEKVDDKSETENLQTIDAVSDSEEKSRQEDVQSDKNVISVSDSEEKSGKEGVQSDKNVTSVSDSEEKSGKEDFQSGKNVTSFSDSEEKSEKESIQSDKNFTFFSDSDENTAQDIQIQRSVHEMSDSNETFSKEDAVQSDGKEDAKTVKASPENDELPDTNKSALREKDSDNQLAKRLLMAEYLESSDSDGKSRPAGKKNGKVFSADEIYSDESSLEHFDMAVDARISKKSGSDSNSKQEEEKEPSALQLVDVSIILEKLKDADLEGYLSGSMPLLEADKKLSSDKEIASLDKEIASLAKLPVPGANKTARKKVLSKKSPKKHTSSRQVIVSSSDSDSDSSFNFSLANRLMISKKTEETVESRNEAARKALFAEDTTSSDDASVGNVADENAKKETKRKLFTEKVEAVSDDDSDFVVKKKTKTDKLLRVPLTAPHEKKKGRPRKTDAKKGKSKRNAVIDDSDDCIDLGSSYSSDLSSVVSDDDFEPSKKRKRIKTMKDSSSDHEKPSKKSKKQGEDKENLADTQGKGRKNIRKLLDKTDLAAETRKATQAERDRRKRVLDRQKMYNQVTDFSDEIGETVTRKLVLDIDQNSKEELVEVDYQLITKLKPHQVEGVKFMWECTVESVQQLKDKKPGSGCVLAHCMGLGKTLQVIAYVHALLTNPNIKSYLKTVLVVCPYNTVLNWASEFDHWQEDVDDCLQVFELANIKPNAFRADVLKNWQESGGVLIIGYNMFRTLVSEKSKRIPKRLRDIFASTLLDPGPDLVVCDEGHILKNEKTAISKAMAQVRTMRRIVLTGTPLQNNLQEYHCMVQFVKPHLLGERKEFQNRFLNPITNGQCADSTAIDVKLMKKRVHILHKLLEGCVQRCDYSAVATFLPPKHEYVVSVRLSDPQVKMYRHYLDTMSSRGGGGTGLFKDFNELRLIWTHPYMLRLSKVRRDLKMDFLDDEDSMASFIDDESSSSSNVECLDDNPQPSTSTGAGEEVEVVNQWKTRSRAKEGIENGEKEEEPVEPEKGWWNEYVDVDDQMKMEMSGKLVLTFEILKQCEEVGDKTLIFTQSLLTLNMIEEFLEIEDLKTEQNPDRVDQDGIGTWVHGLDYFRMDGSTSVDLRKRWIETFNDPNNDRARLFLISTKAGSLGTNLVGANRVIVFDASWNPTHDIQAIFRVYRFGQKKPVYIYRFLAQGTMEEKIYDRQVAKQSLACRVIDEQQIERHFNAADLAELYSFDPDSRTKRPTPLLPKDLLLAEMLMRHKDSWIVTYHEHDSLLRKDAEEEDLTEEERKSAWVEYEAEKEGRNLYQEQNATQFNFSAQGSASLLSLQQMAGELRRKNPHFNLRQINELLSVVIAKTLRNHQMRYHQYYTATQQLAAQKQLIPDDLKNKLGEAFRHTQNFMKLQSMLNYQMNQQPNTSGLRFAQPTANGPAPQNNGPTFVFRQVPHGFYAPHPRQPQDQTYVSSLLADALRKRNVSITTSDNAASSSGPIITEVDETTPSSNVPNSSNIVITEID